MLLAPPPGYGRVEAREGVLVVREELRSAALGAGLETTGGWIEALGGDRGGRPGRAAVTRGKLGSTPAILKQLRRGGMLASVWRDRFLGSGRVTGNLTVPLEAIRRGVRTPAPLALFAAPGPPGFWRGWLALEEVVGGADLWSRLDEGERPAAEVWDEAMSAVRGLHDAGVEHPDLNLGNLLLDASAPPRIHILDLDGATLHAGRLDRGRRAAAVERLERSYEKLAAKGGRRLPPVPWRELYAAGDRRLLDGLRPGAGHGLRMALHRLGWRR